MFTWEAYVVRMGKADLLGNWKQMFAVVLKGTNDDIQYSVICM